MALAEAWKGRADDAGRLSRAVLAANGGTTKLPSAVWLAAFFHQTYERLAPMYGYETKTETRAFDTGSNNGKLMVAVCGEVLRHLSSVNEESR